jgi:hypothetical protein
VSTPPASTTRRTPAETLTYYKNADKELEASQRAGVISQTSYTEQRISLLKQQADEVAQGYQVEINALEAAKTKKGTTGAQNIQIDQKIADARTAMVKAQQDSESELAIVATNEEGRLRKQALAVNTYTSALQQQVETLRQQGLRSASGLGQGDRQRGLTDQQNGIDDRFNQQSLELANQYGDGSRGMSLDEYNAKLKALKTTQQDLHDTVQANYDDMTAAQGDWSAGASSAWQNYLESARDMAGQTKSLFTNAFSGMEDAVANLKRLAWSRDFLPVLSGFLIQVQRQCSHFVEARHFFFLPPFVTTCRLPSLFEGPRQISLFDLRPMIFCLRLLLLLAIRPTANHVRRDNVIPAPADHSLELIGYLEPYSRRVTGFGRLLLHHIQKPFPDPIESHIQDVGAALGGDQCQVDCVLQPERRLLPDGFQAFDGVPLALRLLDSVDRAGSWVVRAQPLRRGVVEDVDQQGAALVGRAWR